MIATLKEPVDVRSLMQGTAPLTMDDVRQLEGAIANGQSTEVRQEAYTLANDVEQGDKSAVKAVRVGIAFYLLGQGKVAEQVLGRIGNNGLAAFYRGQALVGMARYSEAIEAFESAGKHGFDKVSALLHLAL